MAEGTLPYLQQFNVHKDPASTGVRWPNWLKRFDNLLIALDITDKKRQRALLFHYAGSWLSCHPTFLQLSYFSYFLIKNCLIFLLFPTFLLAGAPVPGRV
jgi:hypothetical protein